MLAAYISASPINPGNSDQMTSEPMIPWHEASLAT